MLLPLLSTDRCVKHAAFLEPPASVELPSAPTKDYSRHTRRARRELDIDYIVRVQLLRHQLLTFSVPKHIRVAVQRFKRSGVHSTTRIFNDDDALQAGDGLRLHLGLLQVGDQVVE